MFVVRNAVTKTKRNVYLYHHLDIEVLVTPLNQAIKQLSYHNMNIEMRRWIASQHVQSCEQLASEITKQSNGDLMVEFIPDNRPKINLCELERNKSRSKIVLSRHDHACRKTTHFSVYKTTNTDVLREHVLNCLCLMYQSDPVINLDGLIGRMCSFDFANNWEIAVQTYIGRQYLTITNDI